MFIGHLALGFAAKRVTPQISLAGLLVAAQLADILWPVFLACGLVISHWILDVGTHRPDMPLYPGGPRFGAGLWNSVPGTLVVELAIYGAGLWLYMTATRPRDKVGRWAVGGLTGFLGVVYVVNLAAPPPPSVRALYLTALVAGGLLTVWSWWTDRHRESHISL